MCSFGKINTLPKTNSKSIPYTPENGWGWKIFSFPLGRFGLFSGAFAVSFREGKLDELSDLFCWGNQHCQQRYVSNGGVFLCCMLLEKRPTSGNVSN